MRGKESIVNAAMALSEKFGYKNILCSQVSDLAGTSRTLINYHFGGMKELRKEVLRVAVAQRNRRIILQALSLRDPDLNITPEMRGEMAECMTFDSF